MQRSQQRDTARPRERWTQWPLSAVAPKAQRVSNYLYKLCEVLNGPQTLVDLTGLFCAHAFGHAVLCGYRRPTAEQKATEAETPTAPNLVHKASGTLEASHQPNGRGLSRPLQ